MNLSDYGSQITEIDQISGIRLSNHNVCQMLPAKSLSNATCSPINNNEAVV